MNLVLDRLFLELAAVMPPEVRTKRELALEADNARLRKALGQYGRHELWCLLRDPGRTGECDCGLDAAVSTSSETCPACDGAALPGCAVCRGVGTVLGMSRGLPREEP